MRNCAPRFIFSAINDGIPCRYYIDDVTGTILIAMEFDAARRLEEEKARSRLLNWKPRVSRNGFHKRQKR